MEAFGWVLPHKEEARRRIPQRPVLLQGEILHEGNIAPFRTFVDMYRKGVDFFSTKGLAPDDLQTEISMPGNEVAEKVHNFFEQDSLSQGQHQSQVASGNWSVLNNNLWLNNQRQNAPPQFSHQKNYNVLSSDSGTVVDSENVNGRQSARMPFGPNFTQLSLRPEVARSQTRNQQLTSNGFLHNPQGFQTRSNQAEFLGEDVVPDRHNLALRSLAIFESQQGHAPEHSSGLTRSSERLESAETPVNFDFLGSQQQLMRGQQPGISQPHPRQQVGLSDVQLWQQHYVYKHMQELQRQRQLQQLDQEARQQHSLSQLSVLAKQTTGDPLPALVNGAPIHNASNFLWPGEIVHQMGGDPKIPSTSQTFMVGSTNWARSGSPTVQGFPNGLMLSQDQGQGLRSMGFLPQQLDQSLYGASVTGTRNTVVRPTHPYSSFQGISHDGSDMLTKAGGTQIEKPNAFSSFQVDQGPVFSDQACAEDGVSISKQSFHGKNLFGQGPNVLQNPNSGAVSGNFQQLGSLPKNLQFEEFHGRQECAGWSGSLEGKGGSQIGPAQGLVSLDPTEEKILYNTSDNIWDSAGGFMHNNQLEGSDFLNVFPSVQSGSWSALMQSAVAEASSSDTGVQDEWSGLSFQKTEHSTGNPAQLNDSGKQPTTWSEHNVQAAASLTSRPLHLFDESNMSPSGQSGPGFQQTTPKFTSEQSVRVEGKPEGSHGTPSESLQQSSQTTGKWLDNSPRQKHLLEGRLPIPAHLENAAKGGWPIYEQSESIARSEDVDLDVQNMHGSWVQQQSVPSYKISSQPCNKPNGWNINESLSPNGDNLQICDNQQGDIYKDNNQVAIPFSNSTGGMEQLKCHTDSPQVHREDACANNFTPMANDTLKVNQEKNQQMLNSHQLEYSKHVVVDSSGKYKGNENVGRYQNQPSKHSLVQESSMNNADRGSSETHNKREKGYHKESSNDSYISTNPYPGQQTFTGSGGRENAWSGGSDSRSLVGGNQKLSGQIGRKSSGPRKFQYHPMGNLDMDVTQTDTTEHITRSQGLSQPVSRGPKASEQGYYGNPKFVGGVVSSNAVDMEKGHLDTDPQNNRKGAEEASSKRVLTGYSSTVPSSFDASAVFYVPNRRTIQTSQNMLELLNKVDQPRENNLMRFGSCEMSEPAGSNSSFAQLQQNQSSASQGFGLRLAPPSQRILISKPGWSSQTTSQAVNDLNSQHIDPEIGNKGQAWLSPPATVQSSPHTHEISQQEYWGNKTSITGQTGHELSSGAHRDPRSNFQENVSTTIGAGLYHSKNQLHQHISSSDRNGEFVTDRYPSFAGPNDLSTQGKLASCFRQAHDFQDGRIAEPLSGAFSGEFPSPSHERSGVSSHSEPTNTNSSHLAPVTVSQASVTSGASHQGAFSTMLHNVWTNQSTEQSVPGAPLKVSPSLFLSVSPSSSRMEPTLWAAQKVDDQNIGKGESCPSEFGPCSVNAQQFASGDEQLGKDSSLRQMPFERGGVTTPHIPSSPVNLSSSVGYNLPLRTGGVSLFQSHGQEHMTKHLPSVNSVTSSLSVVPTGQDIGREQHRQDPSFVSQTEHVSVQKSAISDCDSEALGNSGKPSGALQNYSLLNQFQAMKSAENDPSKKGAKRLKVAESGNDVSQVTSMTSHHFAYGYSTMASNSSVDNEPKAEQHAQYPQTDAKTVSFSLVGVEHQSENRDGPSQDMVTSGGNDYQNQSSSHFSLTSSPSSLRVMDHSQLNPQAGPSWFDQFGTYKNGQILAMYDGLGVSRNSVKTAAQQFFFGGVSGGVPAHAAVEERHVDDANQVGTVLQKPGSIVVANEHLASSYSSPPDNGNQPLTVVRLKKRKSLVPWHKEVTHGSQRLRNISVAELEWARAANRRIEKVDDEAEMIEDGLTMPRSRRRLILTTQLMQQLVRSMPASILSAEANSDYETVTYFVAKVALGDACNLISSSGSDSCVQPDDKNSTFGKLISSERVGGQIVSKVVEDYIGRAKKLENDLLRLDKRCWFLDLRVECQDLEKISILNRFARFHRGHPDGVESSSASEAATRKLPQRYVTAVPVPRNLPEEVPCLSL